MGKKELRIMKLTKQTDEQGRTVFRPLTKADKWDLQSGLRNKKGIIIDETLEDSKQCPLEADSDLPFKISLCAIESETDYEKQTRRRLSRELWLQDNKAAAEQLLGEALEENQ